MKSSPVNPDQLTTNLLTRKLLDRRSFLRGATGVSALAMLPMMGSAMAGTAPTPSMTTEFDFEILNFALNLEYLESSYYLYGVTGAGLEGAGIGVSGVGTAGSVTIKANPKVPFADGLAEQLAAELAFDESSHVKFLRATLGANAIARPPIDLLNSFNAMAKAAGIADTFDPFANEVNFLIGAFALEEVGATAYAGAAPLIQNKDYLAASARILLTEGYHGGAIRAALNLLDQNDEALGITSITSKISNLRDTLDGTDDDDQGTAMNGKYNFVPTDSNGLAFARTPRQVLNIVFGAMNASSGLFFPSGINETPLVFP